MSTRPCESPQTRVVAFDLDMTLVDSRPVSRRALQRLVAEYEHHLDVDALMQTYGLPLPNWLPPGSDGTLFRRLQLEEIRHTTSMPGARAALNLLRRTNQRVIVVTASTEQVADEMLAATGLHVDLLVAGLWGGGKATPLTEERAAVFVGDHADDMQAARAAGAVAVGVQTGTSAPHGADVVLADLTQFPEWLASAGLWM